jgi:hypothetical protein
VGVVSRNIPVNSSFATEIIFMLDFMMLLLEHLSDQSESRIYGKLVGYDDQPL